MLQVNAQRFIEAGEIALAIENKFTGFLVLGATISDDALAWLRQQLAVLRADCEFLDLHTARALIDGFCLRYRSTTPSSQQAREGLLVIMNAFKAEVGSRLFMYVLPHRVRYWASEAQLNNPTGVIGADIYQLLQSLASFPDAKHDAIEAGNCIAFGLFTASVYHLMRCTEFGLVSLARSVGVPEEQVARGWDRCIQGIGAEIKRIESTKPTTDWKDETKKLSDLCSWFTTIRTGWRNPVSHIPRVYSENAAVSMFAATGTLFDHLRIHGFRQVEMSGFASTPPEER